MKKPTLATLKAFIRRESKNNNLYIKTKDSFDGRVDCVMPISGMFEKETKTPNFDDKHSLGLNKIWLCGGGNDYITEYTDNNFIGYKVYSACGTFFVAMKKLYFN